MAKKKAAEIDPRNLERWSLGIGTIAHLVPPADEWPRTSLCGRVLLEPIAPVAILGRVYITGRCVDEWGDRIHDEWDEPCGACGFGHRDYPPDPARFLFPDDGRQTCFACTVQRTALAGKRRIPGIPGAMDPST